eukprot:CAMPEP_0185590598 /NCGR_PEP_ID=MMETSP0434-20130131/61331_1 /TAXON_ID=626734 ORGANISM="Favella taraikaensis, Strain Fe Narragansett Bay" /NCGR_SAMPLE_ID=MMETSP0434 /ASSEMBLY_ACC=CAM_ASM_000379 /LENGTH=78 /DNA_ID=CAMNT_0028214909 /DNA_START=8 /DNA_END=240 /DNA_ORIENTATION=-
MARLPLEIFLVASLRAESHLARIAARFAKWRAERSLRAASSLSTTDLYFQPTCWHMLPSTVNLRSFARRVLRSAFGIT